MDVVNIKNKKYVRYKFRKKNGSPIYVYIENIGNEEAEVHKENRRNRIAKCIIGVIIFLIIFTMLRVLWLESREGVDASLSYYIRASIFIIFILEALWKSYEYMLEKGRFNREKIKQIKTMRCVLSAFDNQKPETILDVYLFSIETINFVFFNDDLERTFISLRSREDVKLDEKLSTLQNENSRYKGRRLFISYMDDSELLYISTSAESI